MSVSAYDWFLAIEMARAEGEARRQRLMQEKDAFRRMAARGITRDGVAMTATSLTRPGKPRATETPPPPQAADLDPASLVSLAQGHEPVMVRLTSFASGPDAMMSLAERLLHRAAMLETQDSLMLQNRAAIARELEQWSHLYDDRSPTQDVVALRCHLPESMELGLATAFAGHDFAWQETAAGSGDVHVILALAGGKGERLALEMRQGRWQFTSASRRRIEKRLQAAGLPVFDCVPGAPPLHGQAGLRQLLRAALAQGQLRTGAAEAVSATELRAVVRHWAPRLHSRGVRDCFSLLISAAQLPAVARPRFHQAVRRFLHRVFADHRFIFAVHGEGRMQARALVAMRSEGGLKLRPNRMMFETWRTEFAAAAQAEGLQLVATRSYATREAGSRAGQGPSLNWAVTPRQRARATAALEAWRAVAASGQGGAEAANQLARLEACLAGGAYLEALMAMAEQAQGENEASAEDNIVAAMQGVVATARESLGLTWGEQFAARAGRAINRLRRSSGRAVQFSTTVSRQT